MVVMPHRALHVRVRMMLQGAHAHGAVRMREELVAWRRRLVRGAEAGMVLA